MTFASGAPYGPNTPALRRFLVRLAALGESQRDAVAAAYVRRSVQAAWHEAELELADAITRSGRDDAQAALSGPLMQLVRLPVADAMADTGAEPGLLPHAEPALAALLALLVEDLIGPSTFDVLYGPIAAVIPIDDLRQSNA